MCTVAIDSFVLVVQTTDSTQKFNYGWGCAKIFTMSCFAGMDSKFKSGWYP